jgi:hypothetical protein
MRGHSRLITVDVCAAAAQLAESLYNTLFKKTKITECHGQETLSHCKCFSVRQEVEVEDKVGRLGGKSSLSGVDEQRQ